MAVTINGDTGIDKVVDNTIATADLQDGAVTAAKIASGAIPNSYAGTKNRIINGNMAIDQRNAGASVTAGAGNYILDRWNVYNQTDGAFTVQQVSTAPIGFVNSAKITITTADTSLATAQYSYFRQAIEGYNIADLGWGTANAKTVTISFWVQSSLTGTFSGSITSGGYTRGYPFTYTISSANTWEQKSITIVGDTGGTWSTNNTAGLQLYFSIGTGAAQSGTAGSWGTTQGYIGATGATQLIGTNGATLYITGVQLEAGTTATDFENLQYGQQLALCQRYYYATSSAFIAATATTLCYNLQFPVTMRATPTETHTYAGVANDVYNIITAATPTFVPNGNFPINTGMKFAYDFDAGLTAGQPYQTDWTFSAEL